MKMLDTITSNEMVVDRVPIETYSMGYDDSDYDYMIYNSFSDERHPQKFDKAMVEKADEGFMKFSRKKILLDTYDYEMEDGFARFRDRTTPRIKLIPGLEFMKEYNVILPLANRCMSIFWYNGEEKTIPLVYGAKNRHGFRHSIRSIVGNRLPPFKPYNMCENGDRIKHGLMQWAWILKSSRVCVTVPGDGELGSATTDSLCAKSAMFGFEWVNRVKLFPYSDLTDGVDYVSFNLENMEDKLSDLLKDEDKINSIAENGHKVFLEGYNPRRSAEDLMRYLQ
jgi:hypothetical protein